MYFLVAKSRLHTNVDFKLYGTARDVLFYRHLISKSQIHDNYVLENWELEIRNAEGELVNPKDIAKPLSMADSLA